MITPLVITEPTVEPITLAEAKEHLRVDGTDEDTLIGTYIKGARRYFEWRTGRTVLETVYEMTLDAWPAVALVLPRATPLISVQYIKYTDSAGTINTWSNTLYVLDTYSMPGRVKPAYGEAWPSFTHYPVNPILVRYTAGSDPDDDVDESIRVAIFLLVGGLFQNRESVANIRKVALDYGVDAFISQNVTQYVF